MIKSEDIIAAKDMYYNARQNLIHAVIALERTGGHFEKTISATKQTIGDLCCVIHKLDSEKEE